MIDVMSAKLKPVPFASGMSAALAVLYVLCWLAVLVAPQLAHGWLGLFSTEPAGSLSGLVLGVFVSFVKGWVAGAILVSVYNTTLRR